MPEYLPLTLPDIVENALGERFVPDEIEKLAFRPEAIRDLANAVQNFYENFPATFEKGSDQLRPFIGPQFTVGERLGGKFVAGTGQAFEYEFSGQIRGELTAEVKRYLLYCHGLAFHDRLPYLLDYFRLDPYHPEARKRAPAIKELLVEYSQFSELLRRGIVVPISEEVYGSRINIPDFPLHTDELRARLPDLDPDTLEIIEPIVVEMQVMIERGGYIFDSFFPSKVYVEVLREILRILSAKFTSRDLEEPFRVGILASAPGLNVDLLNIQDIVKIRTDDVAFEKWRSIVSNILTRFHEAEGNYTDAEREIREIAHQEINDWKAEFDKETRKGSLLGRIAKSTQDLAIGAIAGLIADPHAIPVTVLAVINAAVQLAWESVASRRNRVVSTAVRQHFLVLGPDGSS